MEISTGNKLISVIVPVYNVEPYLKDCLDSITGQSYTNLQIIAVDDGSTDDSGNILDAYAQRDSRFKVIHITNGGVSNARNIAMKYACGDYISFVDADDYIHPDMYKLLMEAVEKTQSDISETSYIIELENGIREEYSKEYTTYTKDGNGIVNAFLDEKLTYTVWSKLIKAELCKDLSFDTDMKHSEDAMFSYNVLKKAEKLTIVPECYYIYRRRAGSATSSKLDRKKVMDDISFCDMLYTELSSNEYSADRMYRHVFKTYFDYCKVCIKQKETADIEKEIFSRISNLLHNERAFSVIKDSYGALAAVLRTCPGVFRKTYKAYSSF